MKWSIRITCVVIAAMLFMASCTNGKYDPNKSDRVVNSTTQVTQDPTITTTVGALGGPLGLQILALINAGLLVVHEINAKKRAATVKSDLAVATAATPVVKVV